MAAAAKVILRREPWSDRAAADLEGVAADPEVAGIDGLRHGVEAGETALFGIYAPDGARAGAVTCRFDDFPLGSDIVIPACRAHLPGVDLTRTLLDYFEGLGVRHGAARLRIHTRRKGLARRLARRGYRLAEHVYIKPLRAAHGG